MYLQQYQVVCDGQTLVWTIDVAHELVLLVLDEKVILTTFQFILAWTYQHVLVVIPLQDESTI